ncbi:transmembrane and coiled-coil domains protein 1 isoform X2 [Anguilla anguilla]|uniref:transmembrane and coiled-coil domains protein 1 isoform X2 n=1 Tax=Anguilla anguilla TaxID=7936 RepID=UPI0015AD075A|nr:transmembrane and coiled-coil domains protein 1 isoform X2 [Anguilla anguilla]
MDLSGSEQNDEELDPGGQEVPEPESSLSKITHNALENIGVLGQGLKQLFIHQRRRASVSPHDAGSSPSASSAGSPAPEPLEAAPEAGDGPPALPDTDAPASAHPTALNRVLLQIRGAPMMKRGTSLQSRRSKAAGDPPKGSPQIHRRSTQEALIQVGRPRSSSTTDTPTSPALADVLLASGCPSAEEPERIERLEVSGLAQPASALACGADGSYAVDVVDSTPDPQRTKQAITHLQQKILRLTEQIKIEQTARDDNVAEYLKLANNADKQQSARIKQVFEKKNQKSAQTIQQLQRKLDHYHRKLREVEHNGIPRQPKDVFRDMHQGLKGVGAKVTGFSEGVVDSVKGGLSSFSQATHSAAGAVVSKPREIASLIRNKFGSADNISGLKDSLDESQGEDGSRPLGGCGQLQSSPRYGSEDDCSSATSGSAGANSTTGAPGGPPSSKTNALDSTQSSGFDALFHEIQEIRDTQSRLEESFESLKTHYQKDNTLIMEALQEERYRCERLEEQLNDLTELHQNEILNLKQELASMEEKIAYQSYERARDIQEALEACQTRISKMELQQQQQQVVQLEGLENATARTLLGKLINVLLAVMAVLLVFVSTVANCVVPLMKTRNRTFSTFFLVVMLAFLWKNWDAISGYMDRFLQPPR